MAELRIALVGAGVIGLTHIDTLERMDGFRLAGIVDPGPRAPEIAASNEVPLFAGVSELIAAGAADGVIVATPNELHVPIATQLLGAGLPVLVEKPIANTTDDAAMLLAVADRTRVPLLIGHHRRHNPIIRAAKAAIADGVLGRFVMASVCCSLYKDDAYFDSAWRTRPGSGGPLLINLIHEIDLMRHFFGEVASVSAIGSNAVRGLAVEDTAAVILRFADGGMATLAISDTAVGPWAWDISAGENPARFPAHPVQSHLLTGTEGGLSLPDLTYWSHRDVRDWRLELDRTTLPIRPEDCYVAQIRHFGEVIAGEAAPLVTGRDGAKNLATIDAIRRAAESRREMPVEDIEAAVQAALSAATSR